MQIEIKRLGDGFHLEASNELGNIVHLDAAPEIGGTNLGMRPMQLLMVALGGCGTMDIISILKKQKQDLKDIKISVTGEREKDVVPSLFTKAHVHFRLFGKLDEDKVKKAVDLSMEKYCSVSKTLEKTAVITYSFEIISA
jgi:putative redox protein